MEVMASVPTASWRGASVDFDSAFRRGDEEIVRVALFVAEAEARDLGMLGVGGRRADVSADEIRAIKVALGSCQYNAIPNGTSKGKHGNA